VENGIVTLCVVLFRMCSAEAPQFEEEWRGRTAQFAAPRRDQSAVGYDHQSHRRPVDSRHHP